MAGSVRITHWRGSQVAQMAMRAMNPRVSAVAEQVVAQLRENVREPSPPPSIPGQYPHSRSGDLLNSFGYRVTAPGEAIIYTDCDHAMDLEFGTRKTKPRPFFRKVLFQLRRLFSRIALLR